MRFVKQLALGSITALLLAACGGGSEQAAKVTYSSVVSFGDSLSDAGTYKVGAIAQAGGGMFTVNGITGAIGASTAPSYVWPQLLSAAIVGKPSCAARTGYIFSTNPVLANPVAGCTNYAQGGSRVTEPVGSGHLKGALTEPVVVQIQKFLEVPANGGKFTGTELVTLQGGANDLFEQGRLFQTAFLRFLIDRLVAGAPSNQQAGARTTIENAVGQQIFLEAEAKDIILAAVGGALGHAGTNYSNTVAYAAYVDGGAALGANSTNDAMSVVPTLLVNITAASKELADQTKLLVSKGAKRVVVMNIPDASQGPGQTSAERALTLTLIKAFNDKLKVELAGASSVLLLDAFTESQKQFATPAQFGLTNVTDKVCKVDTTTNPTGSSLFCNPSNVIAGDTSRYLFADGVHPTPYGHKLLAQFVTKELVLAGWL
jgi:phospholipase/lecithinase/hemolysin